MATTPRVGDLDILSELLAVGREKRLIQAERKVPGVKLMVDVGERYVRFRVRRFSMFACAFLAWVSISAPAFGNEVHGAEGHGNWVTSAIDAPDNVYFQAIGPDESMKAAIAILMARGRCATKVFTVKVNGVALPNSGVSGKDVAAEFSVDNRPSHKMMGILTPTGVGRSYRVVFKQSDTEPRLFREMADGEVIQGKIEVWWKNSPLIFHISLDDAGSAIRHINHMCHHAE